VTDDDSDAAVDWLEAEYDRLVRAGYVYNYRQHGCFTIKNDGPLNHNNWNNDDAWRWDTRPCSYPEPQPIDNLIKSDDTHEFRELMARALGEGDAETRTATAVPDCCDLA
jgi:hypothetical protein